MTSEEALLRERMALLGRSLFERGFGVGTSGNLSARIEGGFLATPTNSCLGRLDPERMSKLDEDGRHIVGDPPTKELPLHFAVYAARPKDRAVVHLHSICATAVSCLADIDPANALPPLTAYQAMRFGRLPVVPYFRPGEPDPGPIIAPHAAASRALLLANHGSLVSEATLDAAVAVAEEVEETCKLFLMLRGSAVRILSQAQLEELAAVFGS
jgi:ribulose-5-phosphate 4-epimerase/fuculose-1-phosphate aldolase